MGFKGLLAEKELWTSGSEGPTKTHRKLAFVFSSPYAIALRFPERPDLKKKTLFHITTQTSRFPNQFKTAVLVPFVLYSCAFVSVDFFYHALTSHDIILHLYLATISRTHNCSLFVSNKRQIRGVAHDNGIRLGQRCGPCVWRHGRRYTSFFLAHVITAVKWIQLVRIVG